MPSQEAPRRVPVAPRPSRATQLGIGGPTPPLARATGAPVIATPAVDPSALTTPLDAGTPPLIVGSATTTPLATGATHKPPKPAATATPLAIAATHRPPKPNLGATPLAVSATIKPSKHSATATPLAHDATIKPPKPNAASTPVAVGAGNQAAKPGPAETPLPSETPQAQATADDEASHWDTEPTVARYLPHLRSEALAARAARTLAAAEPEPEPEFVDAEEIPVSSSDAPTLMALTVDAGLTEQLRNKRHADAFATNLSAGTGGILTAPTIDVSELHTLPVVNLGSAEDVEFAAPTSRSNTIPLFDMGQVLPAANDAVRFGTTSPAPAASVPTSSGRVRERKFVIAPDSAMVAPQTKEARRTGLAVWFGLAAAAAGVVAALGVRAHSASERKVPAAAPHVAVEATSAEQPVVTAPVPPAPASAAAEIALDPPSQDAPSQDAPNPNGPRTAATTSPNPKAPTTVATTLRAASSGTSGSAEPSSPPLVKTESVAKPALTAVSGAEKPPATIKRTEVHNAPPAAEPGTDFDRAAARTALANAAAQASACRKEGDPSGTASITITFAPSGRVTSANLQGPPFAGTATGGCIASTMRRANVPAFSGEHVTVTKVIVVE